MTTPEINTDNALSKYVKNVTSQYSKDIRTVTYLDTKPPRVWTTLMETRNLLNVHFIKWILKINLTHILHYYELNVIWRIISNNKFDLLYLFEVNIRFVIFYNIGTIRFLIFFKYTVFFLPPIEEIIPYSLLYCFQAKQTNCINLHYSLTTYIYIIFFFFGGPFS